jgi:tetratricopeptide (TPR) repeat protein
VEPGVRPAAESLHGSAATWPDAVMITTPEHLTLDDLDLAAAVVTTEEAIAIARLRINRRAEGAALVDLGLLHLWTGDHDKARTALTAAEEIFLEIPNPTRRCELPICYGARAVLSALQGDPVAAEIDFDRALGLARELGDVCSQAVVLAARAEFTASTNPSRSGTDARNALEVLDSRGERRWRTWAAQAAAVAARESGQGHAAESMLRTAVSLAPAPLERARTELLLAETLLAGRSGEAAVPLLRSALKVFDDTGARYWAARACAALAGAEPARARDWMRRGRSYGDGPAYDQLWRSATALRLAGFGPGRIIASGKPLSFRTHAAEKTLFVLALAGPDGMHAEQLAECLWPDAGVDHRHLLARVRTLLWDARSGLGRDAWRLQRTGAVISFDTTGVPVDILVARDHAKRAIVSGDPTARAAATASLRRPLLTRWTYEEWVCDNDSYHQQLMDALESRDSRL